MHSEKIIKRIPGDLPGMSKKERQGYIGDLSKQTLPKLQDLLGRQNKLLANKKFISNLPDKGEKIKAFRDKILAEVEYKQEVNQAAELLSKLNIATQGKAAVTELEWTGKYSENQGNEKTVELDSDDETDPLKILAQPTGTGVHKKKIVHLAPEESLIKKEDLEDIESLSKAKPNEIESLLEKEHIKSIAERIEKAKENKTREPFKPYKTTRSNVHDPEKERHQKKNKNWENTSATPPSIIHEPIKLLSVTESLKLEKEKADKLHESQIKHAAERLAERLGLAASGPLPPVLGSYRIRNKSESSEDSEHEEKEVFDDEDDDKGGTVVYTVHTEEE